MKPPLSYQSQRIPPSGMPRLLADGCLGTLAKWLRLLGYDTAYDAFLNDHALARWARSEGRMLLTRDQELAGRHGLRTLLIEDDSLEDQAAQGIAAVGPVSQESPARCPVCNGIPLEVSRSEVRVNVPPYVYQTQERFHRCDGCGRIYWRGTHWRRIETVRQQWTFAGSDDGIWPRTDG